MLSVAIFGLLANVISMILLNKEKGKNLNIKAAYLHLLGDTLSSVAVILGGIAMLFWEMYWLDPLITVLISIYIIKHSWSIIAETVEILMQAVPENITIDEIKKEVEEIENVENLHHIHVWQLDDSTTHLEAHINLKKDMTLSQMMVIKNKISELIKEKFDIQHITLEIGYQCCSGEKELIAKN